MAWTTAKTWATGDELDATTLNTYVRDNQNHLKDRMDNLECVQQLGGNYTTTATSFTDVDATNLSLTITTNGGTVAVGFVGTLENGGSGNRVYLEVDIDSGTAALSGGQLSITRVGINDQSLPFGFVAMVEGLSAGAHTFKLQWAVSSGIGKLYASTSAMLEFWVKEL